MQDIPQNSAGDHLSLQWSGPQRMLITSPRFDQTPAECRSAHASGNDLVTASHCAVPCSAVQLLADPDQFARKNFFVDRCKR